MPPMIQMEQPHWNRFLRQLKMAAGDTDDIKDLWDRILKPMRDDWSRRLPGSLSKTPKVRRKAQSGEIWAGFRSTAGERPFLPWLEFGGIIKFKPGPLRKGERVPNLSGGIRTVPFIKRTREPDGRWRQMVIAGKTDDVAREFAAGIQDIFEKHFR